MIARHGRMRLVLLAGTLLAAACTQPCPPAPAAPAPPTPAWILWGYTPLTDTSPPKRTRETSLSPTARERSSQWRRKIRPGLSSACPKRFRHMEDFGDRRDLRPQSTEQGRS